MQVALGGAQAAVAEAVFDDLEVCSAGQEQEAWSWMRTWVPMSALVRAGFQIALRNQPRGMCPPELRAFASAGRSLPPARRAAR
jgi:hypothetical protein